MLHIALHFLVPLAVVLVIYRGGRPLSWWRPLGLMLLGMLIDLDHLLATPIYDAGRCSIGFHPLHHPIAIALYIGLLAFPKTRWLALGLCIHIVLDGIDCQQTGGVWMHKEV